MSTEQECSEWSFEFYSLDKYYEMLVFTSYLLQCWLFFFLYFINYVVTHRENIQIDLGLIQISLIIDINSFSVQESDIEKISRRNNLIEEPTVLLKLMKIDGQFVKKNSKILPGRKSIDI